VCDNFGIVWVRGPLKQVNQVTLEVPYGLIRRVNQDEAVKQLVCGTPSDQDIKDTSFGFLVGTATWALEYGQSAATDFAHLMLKYTKVDEATHNAMFRDAFCCFVKNNPKTKDMMKTAPIQYLLFFTTICRGKC